MDNEKRISNIEDRISKLEDEVSELHKNTAVSKQEIKMIFNILNEIKDSIKDIAKELGTIKEKPARRWEDTIKTIITVVVTAIVTAVMAGKLF